jgi:outer membrane lipoprotein LolB
MSACARLRRWVLGFSFATLLAACAVAPLAPRSPQAFDLLGRVLVAYSGGAVTANVRWEHSPERDEIWLMTPTGQTLAHIVDTPDGAILTRADQQQYRAASAEALTRQALGWTLPVGPLQYWVRGTPAPGTPPEAVERGPDRRLSAFTQNGWRVVLSYADGSSEAAKVRRLDLKDGANEIRFVIDTWRDAPAG